MGKELSPEQQVALELLCDTDMTQGEIAKQLGVHRNTVTNWRKQDNFKTAQANYVRAKLGDVANEALEKMIEIMRETEDDKLAFEVSKDILDRAGFIAVEQVDITSTPNITVKWEGK